MQPFCYNTQAHPASVSLSASSEGGGFAKQPEVPLDAEPLLGSRGGIHSAKGSQLAPSLNDFCPLLRKLAFSFLRAEPPGSYTHARITGSWPSFTLVNILYFSLN